MDFNMGTTELNKLGALLPVKIASVNKNALPFLEGFYRRLKALSFASSFAIVNNVLKREMKSKPKTNLLRYLYLKKKQQSQVEEFHQSGCAQYDRE